MIYVPPPGARTRSARRSRPRCRSRSSAHHRRHSGHRPLWCASSARCPSSKSTLVGPELPKRDDGRRIQDRHHALRRIFTKRQRRHCLALGHAYLSRGGASRRRRKASDRRRRSASAAILSRAWILSRRSNCFSAIPGPKSIVMIGEIGGSTRRKTRRNSYEGRRPSAAVRRPVVGFIAGRTAKGRRMGHAGTIIAGSKDPIRKAKSPR